MFKPKKIIVYSDYAKMFSSFKLSNYNSSLNDSNESIWFWNYLKADLDRNEWLGVNNKALGGILAAQYLRNNNHVLAKYTTTTDLNRQYMVSNYSRKNQAFVEYSADDVFKMFDAINSGSIFAIRGFVRYGARGENDAIDMLNELAVRFYDDFKDAFRFISLILSYFVKGVCMSNEAEYRFILIKDTPWSGDIDLPIIPKSLNYNEKLCFENPFYLGKDSKCDKPADMCNLDYCKTE